MGKVEDLLRNQGDTMRGSLGSGYTAGIAPPGMSPDQAQRLPARLQGVTKSRNAVDVPTDRIAPDPDQPREDFEPESLERLAESLKTRGQLQPIRVRWSEEAARYIIIMGERRWRAAMLAGISTMSCVIHEAPIAPSELLALQLVENALREDLKPIEQAKAYRRLMESHGWSGAQLARELAVPQPSVVRALALLELPESVQSRVDTGELAPRTAYELSKLPDAAAQVALAEQATTTRLTGDQVAATVKARKAGKITAVPGGKREFKFDDSGKVTISLPPGLDGDAAVMEMLQRAVKKLRAEMKQGQPGQAA
jgi:ParB family transcriptional regulator, chromosome partitioning protein